MEQSEGHSSSGGQGSTMEKKPNDGLTADERRALLFMHRKAYLASEAALKAARSAHQRVCKLAKGELGEHAVDEIKDSIKLLTKEGEAEIRAEIERRLGTARDVNSALGYQFNPTSDMRPAIDKALEDGKNSALEGNACQPPFDPSLPQYDSWIEGWHQGQAILMSDFRSKLKTAPAPEGGDEEAEADADQLDLVDAIEGGGNTADTSSQPFRPDLDEPRVVQPDAEMPTPPPAPNA